MPTSQELLIKGVGEGCLFDTNVSTPKECAGTRLDVCVVRDDGGVWLEGANHVGRGARLALAHVVLAEEELAVQVGRLDRVQVDLPPGRGLEIWVGLET
jgi:hypothetical protein